MAKENVNVYVRGKQNPAATYKEVKLLPNTVGKKNILEQGMVSQPNTRYVVKWNFDLDGKTITLPDNAILQFEGGSLSNGTVDVNNAAIYPGYDGLAQSQNLTIVGVPREGTMRWDYVNQKPIWSTGEKWVNALGGDYEETDAEET